jgi:hypothetical protein
MAGMNLATTSAALAAGAFAAGALAAAGAPKIVLHAPNHDPKVGVHWNYTITARSPSGKAVAATLTERIVDPIGGVHPVQLGNTKKNIAGLRFTGTFSDFIIWPASSRGIPLTLRATVKAGGHTTVVNVPVTPR